MAGYIQVLPNLTQRGHRRGSKRVKVERHEAFQDNGPFLREKEIDIKDDSDSDIEDGEYPPYVSLIEAQKFLFLYNAQVLSTIGQLRMLENSIKKDKKTPDDGGKKSRKMRSMEDYANQMIVMLRERLQTWMKKYNGISADYE